MNRVLLIIGFMTLVPMNDCFKLRSERFRHGSIQNLKPIPHQIRIRALASRDGSIETVREVPVKGSIFEHEKMSFSPPARSFFDSFNLKNIFPFFYGGNRDTRFRRIINKCPKGQKYDGMGNCRKSWQ